MTIQRPRSPHARLNIPFYIFAPDFRHSSAGIRALHYLCHMLNELGEEAYVANAQVTSPKLRTPKLNHDLMVDHFKSGCTPVALYPEVVEGNPLGTAMIARWLLNKPGKLSKQIEIADDDLVFFHDTWCLPEGQTGDRLFIHTLNSSIFHNRDNPLDQQRSGACYYANKYFFSGKDILPEHKSLISLGQNIPRTPDEIADILRSVEVLYCYEPSELISEARACGCPVIFVRSEYWTLDANDNHHKTPGTAVYGEPDALAKAQHSFVSTTVYEDRHIESSWRYVQSLVERVYAESAIRKSCTTPHQLTSLRHYWEIPASERVQHTEMFATLLKQGPNDQGDRQYQMFSARKSLQEIDGQLLAEHMSQWRKQVLFNVVIEAHAEEENLLADTIDSIASQWYQNWHLTIVSELPATSPELLDTPQITWVQCAEGQHAEAINEILPQLPGDWFCFLEAGCTLEGHGLAYFGDTINLYPQAALLYCDEDKTGDSDQFIAPRFKPDFNLELLRNTYYMGPCLLVDRKAFSAVGGLEMNGMAGLYDLSLKLSECQAPDCLIHLPEVLLHTPTVGLRPIDPDLEQTVVRNHLARQQISAVVTDGLLTGTQSVVYTPGSEPLVSIVIPTHDQPGYLSHCIESLIAETHYVNFELILVDHQTTDPDALSYLAELKLRPELAGKLQILRNDEPFNYAALCNQGAAVAHGEFILFLDNDTEFIQTEWLSRLVGQALQKGVAAVAPRLSCPDGNFSVVNQLPRILGMQPLAGPFTLQNTSLIAPGYYGNLQIAQDVSALAGSCLLVSAHVFRNLGGFNAENTPVHESVLELCLRIRQSGLRLIWTPWVDVVHRYQITRKRLATTPNAERLVEESATVEQEYLLSTHMAQLANDPYYHRHLSLQQPYAIEPHAVIDWDTRFHDRLRVLGTPLTSASGEYRMRAPFRALQKAGLAQCCQVHPFGRLEQRVLTPIELARAAPDTLMMQQAIDDLQIHQLKRYRSLNKDIFVTYAVDDIMGNLPKKHYLYNFHIREGKSRLREALSYVDRLIVSTEPIAEFCRDMVKDIVVIPNQLESEKWLGLQPLKRAGKKPRVGWAGAQQHLGDLELIKDVVEATHQEVEWIFMGMCPDFLKPYVHESHNYVDFAAYPAKLASLNLDLAIAPLEQLGFNEGKSNLRLLEYGIMGWPVVCSDVYPYRSNNAPVKRVPNVPEAWIEAIRERIYDLPQAELEGETLRQWVLKHYILENSLSEWLAAITPN